jgi:hypothetical protein
MECHTWLVLYPLQLASFQLACACGITILTTHYRLFIDLKQKSYMEYVSLLGLKVGRDRGRFEHIEYIFIKKSRVSQVLNSRVQSTTIHKWQYDGYLKFSEQNKIHLITLENRVKLKAKLSVMATQLNTKVIDYSNETEFRSN